MRELGVTGRGKGGYGHVFPHGHQFLSQSLPMEEHAGASVRAELVQG